MQETGVAGRGGWLRAVGLMFATGVMSVGNPGVLIAIPFGILVFLMPGKGLLTVALAATGLALVSLGPPDSGFWYLERGWALLVGGCFLAVSLRWPEERFLPKGLGAVFGAFLGMGLLFWARPGDWAVVDWLVESKIEFATGSVLDAVRMSVGSDMIPAELEEQAIGAIAFYRLIFPALLGLASLSALGVAWWLYLRLNKSPKEGINPFKEFRFNDQLVWVLILGILAFLASSGVPERAGINAVVFMGVLYALRGAAVLLFLKGGLSVLGGIVALLAFLVLAPYVVLGAMFVGLGDTWFDLRARRSTPESEA